jgi:hypothetical protein
MGANDAGTQEECAGDMRQDCKAPVYRTVAQDADMH